MDYLPLTLPDTIILVILLVSALLAYVRGLVKELLAIGAWVGSAIATVYGFSFIRPYLQQVIGIELIANICTAIGIFLPALVALSLISHKLSKGIKSSNLSSLDRALGLVFGLIRGAILICIIYVGTLWIWSPNELPALFHQARALPIIQKGTNIFFTLIPQSPKYIDVLRLNGRNLQFTEPQSKLNQSILTQPVPRTESRMEGSSKTGYSDKERRDMQRLIESN